MFINIILLLHFVSLFDLISLTLIYYQEFNYLIDNLIYMFLLLKFIDYSNQIVI